MKTIFTPLKTVFFIGFLVLFSCQQEEIANSSLTEKKFQNKGNGFGNASPEMVLRWNDAATYVVTNTPQPPPITPFWESRYYAMVNIAMYDALNNIVPKYK